MISAIATLAMALLVIRWLAPGLLGVPVDMQLVRTSKEVPPFYANIFRKDDRLAEQIILQDPVTKTRFRPFTENFGDQGPHDVLGFRNNSVPRAADIITIGDSQTYGTNVPIDFNWPNRMRKALKYANISLYNMSTGGWGAVQYLSMMEAAVYFKPKVVVIAFYSGNDPLESFSMAYGSELFEELRPDSSLKASDAPSVTFPPAQEDTWKLTFRDGITITFTPTLRLASNSDHPAARAGYEIIARVAGKITALAESEGIQVIFTVIPTKELVYAPRIAEERYSSPSEYQQLVANENKNIENLRQRILRIKGAHYIDLTAPLQKLAMSPFRLYRDTLNGHPTYEGYAVIGKIIAAEVDTFLPQPPAGIFYCNMFNSPKRLMFAEGNRCWIVPFLSASAANAAGWGLTEEGDYPVFTERDIANFEFMGELDKATFDSSR